jgi:hypothetical protein
VSATLTTATGWNQFYPNLEKVATEKTTEPEIYFLIAAIAISKMTMGLIRTVGKKPSPECEPFSEQDSGGPSIILFRAIMLPFPKSLIPHRRGRRELRE